MSWFEMPSGGRSQSHTQSRAALRHAGAVTALLDDDTPRLSNVCPKGISNFVRCIRSLGLLGWPTKRRGINTERDASHMDEDAIMPRLKNGLQLR